MTHPSWKLFGTLSATLLIAAPARAAIVIGAWPSDRWHGLDR
jgi:hypothetical protein